MGKSPFTDAIETLEKIRDFCERREQSYKAWGTGNVAAEYDLKQIRQKAEDAIKTLTPNQPSAVARKAELDAFGRDIAEP